MTKVSQDLFLFYFARDLMKLLEWKIRLFSFSCSTNTKPLCRCLSLFSTLTSGCVCVCLCVSLLCKCVLILLSALHQCEQVLTEFTCSSGSTNWDSLFFLVCFSWLLVDCVHVLRPAQVQREEAQCHFTDSADGPRARLHR